MTTVYEIRGYMIRHTISLGVLAVVSLWGLWEIWAASNETSGYGLLFGVAFIGGAAYGLWQVMTETRDQVARLETDDSGRTIATLWRPTGALKLEAENGLTGWRLYVKLGPRSIKRPFLFAEHPGHPNPLQIELRPDIEITDGLRAVAPKAIAEFESGAGTSSAES